LYENVFPNTACSSIRSLCVSKYAVCEGNQSHFAVRKRSRCRNECVKNDYNGKEACLDSDGVAIVDVGDASGKVTIYVGGKSAGCARAGETITIIVKNTTYGVEPVNPRGC
jgi:hypothetical protein